MIGRTLGSYRIAEQIGQGGMATIYKAYDVATDRFVAIKTLPEYYSKDPAFRERFAREARAIAHMEHINILPIFAYGEEDGIAYLVMRYLPAGTLADRIGQGPMPLDEAGRILSQVASALDYAHKNGILHRDVKPSNVLIDGEGNAILTDFGIAKMVEGTSELTGSGLIGTPNYMSPEQCQGVKNLTPASDQYSLGVVLYEMLTGSKPYQAETPVAVILMQLNDPLPSPRGQRHDVSEDIEAVLFKALAKQPELRYPTCSAMAEAFARAVSAAQPATVVTPAQSDTAQSAPTDRIAGPELDERTLRVEPQKASATHSPARRGRLPVWVAIAAGVGVLALAAIIIAVVTAPKTLTAVFASATSTPLPTAQPTAASLIAGLNGELNISVCDDPSMQTVCVTTSQSDAQPLRINVGVNTFTAAWGPDGRQAVVSGMEKGGSSVQDSHLYIMNVQDGSLRRIENNHNNVMATWSPDGKWIAFHSSGALSIIRPDGTDYRQLWWIQNECSMQPEWSPDSKKIVFTSVACGSFQLHRNIYVTTLDGIVTPIASMQEPPACDDSRTAFSPDGLLIAYLDEYCHAALLHVDGTQTNVKLGDFNRLWRGEFFPQWGKIQ